MRGGTVRAEASDGCVCDVNVPEEWAGAVGGGRCEFGVVKGYRDIEDRIAMGYVSLDWFFCDDGIGGGVVCCGRLGAREVNLSI